MNILIVEDNEGDLELMKMYLKTELASASLRVKIFSTWNASDAVSLLDKHTFSLVSVDGDFPDHVNCPNRGAGLRMVQTLNERNYKGVVVFYSGDKDSVGLASCLFVSGSPVLSLLKTESDRSKNAEDASIPEWAQKCVELLLKQK